MLAGQLSDMMDANTERDLVSFVTEESNDRPFSVVYGEEGLGKTTLVQKVYNKPEVRDKFMGCAWITVTDHLQHKTLWKDILSQIHYPTMDGKTLEKLDDHNLFLKLYPVLLSNKYLIVLDGICSKTKDLLRPMPADDDMPSKVVITTRNKNETEGYVKEIRGHYLEMSRLTDDQSWRFLKTQLLHSHPSDFESTLKDIYKKCDGVPLALKLLGKLVVWSWNTDRIIDWNELQQRSSVSAQQLLELYYSLLPEHLKKCLHYLALFPKATVDIEAEKLCNLWIADEDINMMINTPSEPQDGMLSTAERYLKELATIGLVQVQEEETPTPTKIKSCSLPHYVRDFLCGARAKEQSLFATHMPQVRALAFYFDKRVGVDKLPLKPKETHEGLRSILFLNTRQQDDHVLSPKSLDLTNCKLLRALDFNWLHFRAIKFHQDINKKLRYLSFRDCYLEKFPSSIEKLEALETLDLRVNPKVVCKIKRISEVLCKLKRLRSLYLPYKFAAETGDETKTKLQLGHLSELENLQNFVSTHCQANDLCSLEKLRYLAATIDGVEDLGVTIQCLIREGASISSSIHLNKNIDFHSERGKFALSELLACGSLNALHLHGRIISWPISDELTEIFLIASEINQDPMPLLGKLRKLQKLGLSNNAFLVGKITCRESAGFPELRYLKLSNFPKLKTWTLEEGAMLKLSTLIIENCKSLETVPDGLTDSALSKN